MKQLNGYYIGNIGCSELYPIFVRRNGKFIEVGAAAEERLEKETKRLKARGVS